VPSEINSQNKNYGCIWIDITIAKNVVDERIVESLLWIREAIAIAAVCELWVFHPRLRLRPFSPEFLDYSKAAK